MPRNGNGVFSLPSNTWNPAVSNTDIDPTDWNATGADIATALTGSIAADGQTTITANLPMSTFRHTGVGDGAARTDYASLGQTQDGKANWVAAGGTADAITATYAPAITALVDGQLCFVRALGANTITAPTFAPNGLTAHTMTLMGGLALPIGAIRAAGQELILRYKLASTIWEWVNYSPLPSTRQVLTSGAAATYTTPGGARQLIIRMWGAGGAGAANSSNGFNGGGGGNTTFNSIAANGGNGGQNTGPGGIGGTGGLGAASLRISGNAGFGGISIGTGFGVSGPGGPGTSGPLGAAPGSGSSAVANSGAGGSGGAGSSFTGTTGGAGGSGEYVEIIINSPAATYTYTIGAGGVVGGGSAGTFGFGGNGGSGQIIVEEFY